MTDADWELLAKCLAGEGDTIDMLWLKMWINSNPENEKVFFKLSQIYHTPVLDEMNEDESFQKLTARLKKDELL